MKFRIQSLRSDFWFAFLSSRVTVLSFVIIVVFVLGCGFAEIFTVHRPFDPGTFDIMDNKLPPAWLEGGSSAYLLGTDTQGRDVLSAILYGGRISMIVGLGAVVLGVGLGVIAGLLAGFNGGLTDAVIMRLAEIQFSFPPILLALLFSGILKAALPPEQFGQAAIPILILSIGLSGWVQYARVVRASTMVERNKEYVLACHAIGFSRSYILRRHILPNIVGPVMVIAMLQIAVAIVTEATLSFLGLGTPLTEPSLGGLIQAGAEYLFSGVWWVVVFPGLALLVLVIAFNLVADWFRDYLNPRLR